MKKSLITMLVALCLVGALGVGATLAYLSATSEVKTNTFTIGAVGISLSETASVEGTNATVVENATKTGYDFTGIQPGDVLGKVPVVTVAADSKDCYVVVKVTGDALLTANIDTNLWESKGNGIYAYKQKCTAGDELTVFTTVTVDSEITEKPENGFTPIVVKAAAVQADNNTADAAYTAAAALLN